jgi:hypothetical protein
MLFPLSNPNNVISTGMIELKITDLMFGPPRTAWQVQFLEWRMITDYFRTGDDGDVFLSFNCSPDEVDPKPTALLFYSASIISIKYGRSMVNRKQHPAQPSDCNSETGKARRQLLCGSSSSRRFQTPYCQMLPYRGFGFVGQELSRDCESYLGKKRTQRAWKEDCVRMLHLIASFLATAQNSIHCT